jgi:DNA-binding SARP family transcriptional activator
MQVRLLGPLDVVVGGEPRQVGGLRRKAVLAALALHDGEVVSADHLLAAVWGDAAPPTAVNTLQSHVSGLRDVLGDKAAILARPPGYVLDLGADGTDVRAAERLLARAEQSERPAGAVRHLLDALALWRGQPLADVSGLAWFDGQVQRLDLLRTRIRQALAEARLAAGEHEQAVPELEQMAADHPLDERVHAQLMLALYRSGRPADALAAYHRIRRTLGEELGIDPGQALRDLETAILRQDPSLDAPSPPASPAIPVPAQLPPAVPGFTGRGAELARLDALAPQIARAGTASAAPMVIAVLSGTAGVGKTALAVHWAHQVAHRFPDGQLYVNLRGFDPGGPAQDPVEVLHGFLLALGVPPGRMPSGLDARTALFRSRLAGKRVLVVLDNARDAGQVRPLLPGSAGCQAIVTSRNKLTALIASEGAFPLTLDLLSVAEARDLLARRLGTGRVTAEPGAADEIVTRCARLPLALAVAAARAAIQPDLLLTALAGELREAAAALDAFHGDDHVTNVRAVLSWSYRAVSTGAARLFRLLGLHSGPDISRAAAASLAGIPAGQAAALLAELAQAHMLTEHVPGRYGCHDLLRAFGAELARSVDTEDERRAALHRMLDHYLYAAHAASIQLANIDTIVLPPPGDPSWIPPAAPADRDAAWTWFLAEQDVVLAAIYQASAAGFNVHAWQLAWTMDTFLNHRGRWHEQAGIMRTAADAVRKLDDPAALAAILRALTRVCTELGLWDEAHARGEEALRVATEIADPNMQAFVHLQVGYIYDRQGRPAAAIAHARDALDLYRTAGNHTGEAQALNCLGWAHACLDEHELALTFCQQALPLLQRSGDQASEAGTWDSIGYAHHNLGHYQQAIADYQTALAVARSADDKGCEAVVLSHLGDTLHATASYDAARDALLQALAIFDELGRPEADEIRARLDSGQLTRQA